MSKVLDPFAEFQKPVAEITALAPKDEAQFQNWVKANKITDLDHPDSHYDYRGYWKETGNKPVRFGVDHFPDTYKQHGHPTFSVESKYSTGSNDGGHWNGDTYVPSSRSADDPFAEFQEPTKVAPKGKLEATPIAESTTGSRTREAVLGTVEGLGIDPASPILGTLKNYGSGLANLAKSVVVDPLMGRGTAGAQEALKGVGKGFVQGPQEALEGVQGGDYEKTAHGLGLTLGMLGGAYLGTKRGQATAARAVDTAAMGIKPVVKGIEATANFAGRRAADVLGVTSGAGSEAIKTAFNKPTQALFDAMRGKTTEADIVHGFKDAIGQVKEARGEAYRSKLAALPDTDLSKGLRSIRANAESQLSKFGIKRVVAEDGTKSLDFSRSTIHDTAEQSKVARLLNDLDGWGSQAGDASPLGVDTLKRRVADFYSDSGQARSFVQSIKKATDSVLNQVPGYGEMTKGYASASDFIKKIEKEFSVGPNANLGTAIRKISYALKQNNEYRNLLIDALDGTTGATLKEQLAGYHLSKAAPRGITGPLTSASTLLGVITGTVSPAALPALMATSPRLIGEIVTGLGRIAKNGALPAAEEVASGARQAVKAAAPSARVQPRSQLQLPTSTDAPFPLPSSGNRFAMPENIGLQNMNDLEAFLAQEKAMGRSELLPTRASRPGEPPVIDVEPTKMTPHSFNMPASPMQSLKALGVGSGAQPGKTPMPAAKPMTLKDLLTVGNQNVARDSAGRIIRRKTGQ